MVRKDTDELRRKYDAIFDSDKLKAKAFDKIAENYYLGNFGSMQKSDIDVLMFSIFIEGILERSESDINTYSDYTLAKQLGIPQSRISNLKVKKQLQYPYEGFDWKKSFGRVCNNAIFEGGKIRINLRDRNLYYELKNQIDESGSYVETTLTSNLLVISVTDFYDLASKLMNETEINELQSAIKKKYVADTQFCEDFDKSPIGETLKNKLGETMVDVVCEVIKDIAPAHIGIGISALKAVYTVIKKRQER